MAHQIRAAVTNRDVVTLQKLINLGTIDLNQRLNGSTPLGLAVYFGDYQCTVKLLEAGANPDIRMAILDIQCEYQTSGAEPPLTFLVRKGTSKCLELARLLLNHGANPGALDTSSFSPLFYAVVKDSAEWVRLLLKYKVDLTQQIGARNNLDRLPLPNTILHIAYEYDVKVTGLLVHHAHREGVLHLIRDSEGNSILHFLIKNGKQDRALNLVTAFNTRKRGAEGRSVISMKSLVTSPNLFGETPLLEVVRNTNETTSTDLACALILESCDVKACESFSFLDDSNCVTKAIFQQILTQSDSNTKSSADAFDILNLLFTSGALSNKPIWLDKDQDDIYVEMLILTSLTMRRCMEIGDPLLEKIKILRSTPLDLKYQTRRTLRRYISYDEDLSKLDYLPQWLKDFLLYRV